MEVSQKRGAHGTRYVFHDDCVDYAWKDSTGSGSFSVSHTEISHVRQALTERPTWFRNAGLLYALVGAALIVVGVAAGIDLGAFWFVIGAICYAAFHLNVTLYVILPSDKDNLLVIGNADGERIINEIEKRRAAILRAEYDFFPQGDPPGKLGARFDLLHREGLLSDEARALRLGTMVRMGQGR